MCMQMNHLKYEIRKTCKIWAENSEKLFYSSLVYLSFMEKRLKMKNRRRI